MTMATDANRALIKEISREIIKEVIPNVIEAHVNSCVVGKEFIKWKNRFTGIVIGLILCSGLTGGTFVLLIKTILA